MTDSPEQTHNRRAIDRIDEAVVGIMKTCHTLQPDEIKTLSQVIVVLLDVKRVLKEFA